VDLVDELGGPEDLKRALDRERARADRSGDRFSVIAFASVERDAAADTLVHLAPILRERLRFTDEFGRLDRERIGVVLPSTPPQGARQVAEELTAQFSAKGARVHWEVYCYPGNEPPSECSRDVRLGGDENKPLRDAGPEYHAAEALFVYPFPLWKRILDVVGAVSGLLLFWPLVAAGGVAIKLTSRGPVLFRQRRSGRAGRPFVMVKLRTMVNGAETRKQELAGQNERDGPAFKIKNDPRVTPVGRVLRATGIDEIPQLWNVLRGDMSLVGPRPLPCDESDACRGWHRRRLEVKPGITCIWQVSRRSEVSFDDWVRMDLQYARSQSLWTDLKLMLRTIPAALSGKAAH
jgi:lipopolysaccharide/colanic/teichoic acid biosynthesis glycosyltransferase